MAVARRTLPAAISRRAITISRLSDPMSGLAPFKSCRARFTASITSSKRLELSCKQSSTVIRAIRNDIPSGHSTQETSCSWEPRTKVSPTRVFTNFARPAVYQMLGRKLKKPRSPYDRCSPNSLKSYLFECCVVMNSAKIGRASCRERVCLYV